MGLLKREFTNECSGSMQNADPPRQPRDFHVKTVGSKYFVNDRPFYSKACYTASTSIYQRAAYVLTVAYLFESCFVIPYRATTPLAGMIDHDGPTLDDRIDIIC